VTIPQTIEAQKGLYQRLSHFLKETSLRNSQPPAPLYFITVEYLHPLDR
jgi:hypothetical protein